MKRRGRPPYPDILTPRQQEVLALLREGLTNPQIAERLGISLDGAKFLVGEVISRLGVADRTEAARWQPAAAAPSPTGRLAWALAPIALLRKITPSWLPPAASGAIIVAALAGVGIIEWAVVSTGGGGPQVVAPTATAGPAPVARTGIPALDATIDKLVRQDVSGLLDLVQFQDIGCSVEQIPGSPPPCPTGVADGTPVQAFGVSQCEGYYVTNRDDLRQQFEGMFKSEDQSSVYAVLRDPENDNDYIVAVTPGSTPSPTADGTMWYVTPGGNIRHLVVPCGVGIAARIKFFGLSNYVVGPFNSCSPPPGEYASLIVTVDGLSPGSVLPQFWGPASSTLGLSTGERAIVTVTAATRWYGAQSRLEDVRTGMQLQAVGRRQTDCTILAETVLSELAGTPVTGPPTSGTIEGQIVQDVDGDGKFSLPDMPARTLVQLVAPDHTFSMYTAPDGTFRIVGIPDETYTLRLWWTPGFVNLSADTTNSGLASLPVSVHIKADQAISLTMPSTIFVNPETPGVLPFPANEADAAGPNIVTGVLDLQAGGQ